MYMRLWLERAIFMFARDWVNVETSKAEPAPEFADALKEVVLSAMLVIQRDRIDNPDNTEAEGAQLFEAMLEVVGLELIKRQRMKAWREAVLTLAMAALERMPRKDASDRFGQSDEVLALLDRDPVGRP